MKSIKWVLFAAIAASACLATQLAAKEVLLECNGEVKNCGKYSGSTRCDTPTKVMHVISYEGDTMKQIDDSGFLNFKGICEATEALVTCSAPVEMGKDGSPSEEHGTRTVYLNRATGQISWSYESTFGLQHRLNTSANSMKGWLRKFDAQCTIRDNKTLF